MHKKFNYKKAILQVIWMAFILFSCPVFAQVGNNNTTKIEPKPTNILSGFAGVNVSLKATYFTFGGPGLRYKSQKTSLFLGLLPAIRVNKDEVIPSVGGGFQIIYKQVALTLPAFYYAKGKWEFATGLGVVFPLKTTRK